MVYRKRMRSTRKRPISKKKRIAKKVMKLKYNPTLSYSGAMNLKVEKTGTLRQGLYSNGERGCRMVVPWGNGNGAFTGYAPEQAPTFLSSAEWISVRDRYQQYRIIGVKIIVTPATRVGVSSDARTLDAIHVGSSNEVIENDNDLTVRRI